MKYMWFVGIVAIVGCSAENPGGGGIGTGGTGALPGTSGQGGDGVAGDPAAPPGYQQDDFTGGTGGTSGGAGPGPGPGVPSGGATGVGSGGDAPPPPVPQAGQWQAPDLNPVDPGQTPGEEDEEVCGSVTVDADVEIITQRGNLLVVFDRSGSMSDLWGAVPRHQAATDALVAAITPTQDLLTVGAIFFPSVQDLTLCNPVDPFAWIPGGDASCLNAIGVSCFVSDITSPDQINFREGPAFINELQTGIYSVLTGAGMTPLELAVTEADAAISSGTFDGAVAVVIMTDGEPTCGDFAPNIDAIVSRWLSSGIKTYVVGLPGSAPAEGLLTQIAVTGGTDRFIVPDDPAALQAELASIAGETVKVGLSSCEINFQQEQDADIEKLHLVVTEQGVLKDVPKQLTGGGWSVNADGTVATLEGTLCEDAMNGRFESVRFDFGCVELPIFIE